MASYEEHGFYCLKCGRKGIPIQRKTCHKYGRHHRKKLYCIYCKQEVNHIECRTQAEVDEFKENFENGVYADECEESLSFIRNTRQRQKLLGS